MKTIYDVLRETGYAGRPSTIFRDNYSRLFQITSDGKVVRIIVKGGDKSLLPKDIVILDGEFVFCLEGKQTTNANEEQLKEIMRCIAVRPMPNIGALLL